jgi:hypothetical protein
VFLAYPEDPEYLVFLAYPEDPDDLVGQHFVSLPFLQRFHLHHKVRCNLHFEGLL